VWAGSGAYPFAELALSADTKRRPLESRDRIRADLRTTCPADVGLGVRKDGRPGLVVGLTNDGVAAIPGVLRISVVRPDGKELAGGSLDPGLPLPGKIRQAQLQLRAGDIDVDVFEGGVSVLDWRGLRLRAELEVKGKRYPVTWACTPKPNADGTLTLQSNIG
jgi:hypothetical protein